MLLLFYSTMIESIYNKVMLHKRPTKTRQWTFYNLEVYQLSLLLRSNFYVPYDSIIKNALVVNARFVHSFCLHAFIRNKTHKFPFIFPRHIFLLYANLHTNDSFFHKFTTDATDSLHMLSQTDAKRSLK